MSEVNPKNATSQAGKRKVSDKRSADFGNGWNHLAYVYKGNSATLYKNGIFDTVFPFLPASSSINTTRQFNYFGRGLKPDREYNKKVVLDDIKIYSRALTQAEVQIDMNTTDVSVLLTGICDQNSSVYRSALLVFFLNYTIGNQKIPGNQSKKKFLFELPT
jgi:hypothetical protein